MAKGSEDQQEVSVLVAARPNRMRDSLGIILRTMPQIDAIRYADDGSSALKMARELHPTLVVLDTNLPGQDAAAVLGQIKGNGSQGLCIILTDNAHQERQARSAGADATLLKGFPAARLFETVDTLLATKRQTSQPRHSSQDGEGG